MRQGTSVSEKAKHAILSLASDKKEHTNSYFVEKLKGDFSKNTVYKYLTELVIGKMIEMKHGKDSIKPRLLISEFGFHEWEKVMMKETVNEWIDKMSAKESRHWLHRSVNEISRLHGMIRAQDKQHMQNRDFQVRFCLTLKKFNELFQKGKLKGFSFEEYMERLKRESERRKAAMIEYAKKHPLPEKASIQDLEEYHKRFKEYYKKKSSAGFAEESND